MNAATATPPPVAADSRSALPWVLLATAAFAALRVAHPWPEHLLFFLASAGLAFVACAALAGTNITARTLLLGAVLWRALFVTLPPTLSDDIFRYVWEGQIQWHGWNPFVVAPTDPQLHSLRNDIWPWINNPDASAIYPPLAQLVFKGLAAFAGVTGFKVAFCLIDLLLIGVLLQGARRRSLEPGRVAWYAWNPLVVVEVAGSGHLEPLALLPLVWAIDQIGRQPLRGWVALTASVTCKYAAGLLALPFWRQSRPGPAAVLAGVGLVALTTAPYVDAGRELFESLLLYTDKWRYNDMLFGVLVAMFDSLTVSKVIAAAVLVSFTAGVSWRRMPLARQCLWILTALLLLSPTIHPWYLLWVAVLLPWASSWAVLGWTGSVLLAYVFLFPVAGSDPVDKGALWVRLLQLLPFLVGLALDLRGRSGKKAAGAAVETGEPGAAGHPPDATRAAPGGRVVLMMPALDEEESLPLVLADLDAVRQEHGLPDDILLVDNGSSDATPDIARAAGATVLHEPERGYGAACLRAIEHLRHDPPGILVFMDADRSDHAEELVDLVRPLREDGMDMVIGSRTRGEHENGALLPQAVFGNWLATRLIAWGYGFRYTDLGPFRALRFDALERLRMTDRDFGWTVEMQVRALQENLRVCEIPVRYRKRVGTSKISGTIGGSVRAGIKILATLWRLRKRSS